jgi:hypothetical protein
MKLTSEWGGTEPVTVAPDVDKASSEIVVIVRQPRSNRFAS